MSDPKETIYGVWVSPQGKAHLAVSDGKGSRREERADFFPYAWVDALPEEGKYETERLEGEDAFSHLLRFETVEDFRAVTGGRNKGCMVETVRSFESQYLLSQGKHLFQGITFAELRRCQCDIETACSVQGGFSDPRRREDRVLAIGLQFNGEGDPAILALDEMTDEAERNMLKRFNALLQEKDPDVIEGHNIFNFDLDYLRRRCHRFRVPCAWGRFGQEASFRKSRMRVAERWIDFSRCDIPGRTVIDTYLLIQLFDVTARDMISYTLKDVAVYLGVTEVDSAERTYLPGPAIQQAFLNDREKFLAYLGDDLRETRGIADVLLPTYFAQTANFPMTLQEATLRGTANKVDLLLLEKYYHARRSLPLGAEVKTFEGGYTRSFETGVFRHVLHFDVASLYPSLIMLIGRNPANDTLGIFIPLLRELREYRLKYKELARAAETEDLRREYNARQTSFKILVNSFYGYLGFPGARFGDSDLAAEVTRRGRELLQALIDEFERLGCKVLEADTDGIYLSSAEDWEKPEGLLEKVSHLLPQGIELEYDGRYVSMLCYKAKNYALYDGGKVTIRGSALRSRGIEPYLKQLTDQLIRYLLGVEEKSPLELAEDFRKKINAGGIDIGTLARSEYLSQDPEKYRQKMEAGGKPRRASLEVALKIDPMPKMGERVSYYIKPRGKGQTSDWQRAVAVDAHDPATAPYDPAYYTKKIDAWIKRYAEFLDTDGKERQGELF